jgi:hypothetical protein
VNENDDGKAHDIQGFKAIILGCILGRSLILRIVINPFHTNGFLRFKNPIIKIPRPFAWGFFSHQHVKINPKKNLGLGHLQ